jgi:hypothetical protein
VSNRNNDSEEYKDSQGRTVTTHLKVTGSGLEPILKDKPIIRAQPTHADNYTWCNRCKEKGKVIRFQYFDVIKIVNINSFFHWQTQVLRRFYKIFDEESWNIHVHDNEKLPSTREVAAA